MEINYDSKYNVAYLKFREKSGEVDTIRISDELNIDISPDGKICGIELLNANEQLQIVKGGKFILTDKLTGKTAQLPVGVR